MDALVDTYRTGSDDEAARALATLLDDHAAPLVRRIVRRRLGSACAELDDVCAQVVFQLLLRLRRERGESNPASIGAFASYVATAAHHGCDRYVRSRYPLLWQLRSRIRYVLQHDARFALWRSGDGPLTCGLAEWRPRPAVAESDAVVVGRVPAHDVATWLARLFAAAAAPLELTDVVARAAAFWGVPQHHEDHDGAIDALHATEPRIDVQLAQRAGLASLWNEIRDLPIRQRHALLLNLRDDAVTLFVTVQVASLRDIAAALEVPVEVLAALWNDLPLPDNAIAERLGCTRQQVINLRLAARKRLANRLGGESQYRPLPRL